MRHILLILTIFTLSLGMLAQSKEKKPVQNETGVTSGTTVMTGTTGTFSIWNGTSIHNLPVPDRKCAFDFSAKWVLGEGKSNPKPKETLSGELTYRDPNRIVASVYTPPPMRQVCPYEKAIELFGQDRVSYDEVEAFTVDSACAKPSEHGCPVKVRQILVDAEVVYEEPAKK